MEKDDRSLVTRDQIVERVVLEERFVQRFSKDMRTAELGRPRTEPAVRRAENSRTQFALPVLSEKAVLEVVDDTIAIERIVGRREAAT